MWDEEVAEVQTWHVPIRDTCSMRGTESPRAQCHSCQCLPPPPHHPVTPTPASNIPSPTPHPCDTHTSTPHCTPIPPPHPQQLQAQSLPAAHRPGAPWVPPAHRQPWHLITHAEAPTASCTSVYSPLVLANQHRTTSHPSLSTLPLTTHPDPLAHPWPVPPEPLSSFHSISLGMDQGHSSPMHGPSVPP